MRSPEWSTGVPLLSQLGLLSWLADFSLPPPPSVFLSSPLHPPPYSLPILHICMLVMGKRFLTFGQVWVQVWHQCCTCKFSPLLFLIFSRSVVDNTGNLGPCTLFWQIYFGKYLWPQMHHYYFLNWLTNIELVWRKMWKHRVFKRIKVSRTPQ